MYRICKRCVMDGSDPDLALDENGICNHCHQAIKSNFLAKLERKFLPEIIEKIKNDGKGKKYDCLIGLSGGVDSSLTLHYLVELGLRPLAYTIDNGWNTKESDENILRLVEGMKVRLFRYTIDLKKFRELQAAFMKAGQKNLEIPTDHILMASSYEMASKYGIKWIISGGNVATESIMPASWGYNARDLVHIKDIYKKITGKRLKGLPMCSLLKFNWYRWFKKIKVIYLLDYYEYNREQAVKLLEEKYGYKNYGEKHCESVFTWWFQNYYLFEKYGIDKRKAHYSSLINSGQITRREALDRLTENPEFPSLGFEQKVMKYPKRDYKEFKTDEYWYNLISKLIRKLRKYGIVE